MAAALFAIYYSRNLRGLGELLSAETD